MSEDSARRLAEYPAAAAIAITAFTAALLGTLFGICSARRLTPTARESTARESPHEPPERDLISWTRLSRMEEELDRTREDLGAARRNYELDTGLLKQEIKRLELLLGRFSTGTSKEAGVPGRPLASSSESGPGYRSMELVDPLREDTRTIRFAPLASMKGEGTARSGSGNP